MSLRLHGRLWHPIYRGLWLIAAAWLAACRQIPAPATTPAASAPGQMVPVTPNPPPPDVEKPLPAPPVPPQPRQQPMPSTAAVAQTSTAAHPSPAAKPVRPATAAVAPPPAAARETAKPVTPALDLQALEQRLRDTQAIGVFTKLSLKNQVDDLLQEARAYHRNPLPAALPPLRQRFEGLMLKVLSSLQGGDPPLASAVAASREALWGILMDPDKLSKI